MADNTKIEWCDATWSPITGCTRISEGCANCYAERMTARNMWGYDFTPGTFHPHRLDQPLRWKKPRRIFVSSMGDLFHGQIHDDGGCSLSMPSYAWDEILDVVDACPRHTFIMLTKRADVMDVVMDQTREAASCVGQLEVIPNVWLGVTAENQKRADERVPILLQIPAAQRFVSVEPMLGPVKWLNIPPHMPSWVICGAETGPGKRHMDLDWARDLRDQCIAAHVPFFFKKDSDGNSALDGREWKQFPALRAKGVEPGRGDNTRPQCAAEGAG